MNKIFIIGLPRTGTTSLSYTLLQCGYTVAHTAYTKDTFTAARVIADTPVYCDFPFFDEKFPNSKFIYLERELPLWTPSITTLIQKVQSYTQQDANALHPIFLRCFEKVFGALHNEQITDSPYLRSRYAKHKQSVVDFFQDKEERLLTINLTIEEDFHKLSEFLDCHQLYNTNLFPDAKFPLLNQNGAITDWQKVRDPNKISSHFCGPNRRRYFYDLS
ncbi:sulfotransferase [Marinibactrum halimedae]|uniref:Sulfotransferase family protein n=1 Tax=Marinibactrum halimedae TaxID=1444977 RepID=A0AA37WN12_9GAMM|nr:sulfotransferase [Marinibactrum halimedae]MCD9459332.1 sulfotransferase family protein [Marinibactrum halimedae]GLS25776.1 sulfotransferase family protein [Marinibactrum halimedae]